VIYKKRSWSALTKFPHAVFHQVHGRKPGIGFYK